MTLLWNGDWQTGDRSQWGAWEWGGTFDGTPPLASRLTVTRGIDGMRGPNGGDSFARMEVDAGDQYGGSTGWRLLGRPREPLQPLFPGYDSTWVWATATPPGFPPNAGTPGYQTWIAGLEMHHSNGVNGAPGHFVALGDRYNADVAGGDLAARVKKLNLDYLRGYTAGAWYVNVARYLHDPVEGAVEVYSGRVGDPDLAHIVSMTDIPTAYLPYQGTPLYNYALFGLYVAQVGSKPTVLYMSRNREYSTLAEGLAYGRSLLGAAPTPTPTPTPTVDVPGALAALTTAATAIGAARKALGA